LDLTHIDSHMFSMLRPLLADQYVGLGFDRQLPVLMTRQPRWVAALSEAAILGSHRLRTSGIQVIGWGPLRELTRTRRNRSLLGVQT
jgi:hypothetical protein